MDWLQTARNMLVITAAAALGFQVAPDGLSFGACPSCGEEFRNNPGRSHDRRYRCAARERFWACYSNGTDGCGARGSAVDLAAWKLLGRPLVAGDVDGWRVVGAFFRGDSVAFVQAPPFRTPPPSKPRPRLDRMALARDFFDFRRADEDAEVAGWLASRTLDATAIADQGLAFALPPGFRAEWARYRREDWDRTGHRLLLPAYEPDPDVAGQFRLAGLHARCVRPCEPGDKAAWPSGTGASGLVMLTDVVRPWDDGAGERLVTVCEGATDFLALALEAPAHRGAVIGSWSGSARELIAGLIPEGWTVVLALHGDDGGANQERAWVRAFADCGKHHHLRRYVWPTLDREAEADLQSLRPKEEG